MSHTLSGCAISAADKVEVKFLAGSGLLAVGWSGIPTSVRNEKSWELAFDTRQVEAGCQPMEAFCVKTSEYAIVKLREEMRKDSSDQCDPINIDPGTRIGLFAFSSICHFLKFNLNSFLSGSGACPSKLPSSQPLRTAKFCEPFHRQFS